MFNATFDLSSLNGENGFIINGITANDYAGYSVASAGDINGDGKNDIIIGTPYMPIKVRACLLRRT
ncbi:MAG: Putative outer membrane protein [Candidatus Midichloria mitochondrii]|uniref:Putative outer membrane protein n=1 Tax=Midichloria mitochondrii (strain IricVA) TaxID=696127 RepID=F7XW76_MIDMI|nr:integrin alpha [Candidatus Midichloria mitochondrii]AEI88925.1 putative outer membrane protein [Candidatus Midichloria mitochondrii IricVA]MDJ1256833.1 integrin alpha [Candidatus Midichloria mitochondrii]MDJ1288567.1 integrin alpha [Candidatus Midichloria mitochondrii]MDJ1299344.1 integrin alpha [Candidatus Midichloria mitochondrii]MDJ1313417.1 integrin alpha [Candidatus Midichloria mitochondrii]